MGAEVRPAFFLEDVHGIHLEGVKAAEAGKAKNFVLKNVTGFSMRKKR
jgi:hypothetical protein